MSRGNWKQLQEVALEQARKEKLKPMTANQALYLKAVERSVITVCVGPAGTGKTHLACGLAARMLSEGKVKRVVITRPLVSCSGRAGQGVGFLPGALEEKVSPYMRPLLDALAEFVSPKELQKLLEDGTVEMRPLDLMRGASIKESLLICDEAQNAEFEQLYMLLTRFDRGTKVVVTGDVSRKQTDLRGSGPCPLTQVIEAFEPDCHREVSIVRLGREDIVRHPLVRWVDARLSGEGDEVGEEWVNFKCPECRTTVWAPEEADQVACHHCDTPSDLWDADDYFSPTKARRRDEDCQMGMRRKP